MSKRLLLILALAFMPLTAAADDTPAPDATDTPAATDSPAPAATPYNAAGALGPSATGGGTGSSANDSGTLQPAGNNPLQSTSNDSTGLTAPNSQTLQAPASSDQSLSVIRNDADGAPHTPDSGSNYWIWLGLVIAFGALLAGVVWLWRVSRPQPGVALPNGNLPGSAPVAGDKTAPEPTTSQRLRITIDRPAGEVFDFVLDPKNTPKWIDFIKAEETNEWPPQNGTIYKNQDPEGNWREFELSELKPGESFVMSRMSSPYHVRYTITPESDTASELEYYEWMDEGNLAEPFTTKELEELKKVLEAKPEETPKDKVEDTADELPEAGHKPKPSKDS